MTPLDAAILASIDAGASVRGAAKQHDVSKDRVHRLVKLHRSTPVDEAVRLIQQGTAALVKAAKGEK